MQCPRAHSIFFASHRNFTLIHIHSRCPWYLDKRTQKPSLFVPHFIHGCQCAGDTYHGNLSIYQDCGIYLFIFLIIHTKMAFNLPEMLSHRIENKSSPQSHHAESDLCVLKSVCNGNTHLLPENRHRFLRVSCVSMWMASNGNCFGRASLCVVSNIHVPIAGACASRAINKQQQRMSEKQHNQKRCGKRVVVDSTFPTVSECCWHRQNAPNGDCRRTQHTHSWIKLNLRFYC